MLPKLPIGQQDFRGIREEGALYVDKTEYIHRLIEAGKYFFLARPRRFGKSLMLSVIKELYSGSRELFEGLWIERRWDWSRTRPVVHIAFNEINYKDQPLEMGLRKALLRQFEAYGLTPKGDLVSELFKELLVELAAARGRVVLLIDEYDKPLIDYLAKDNIHIALEHQSTLKSFYSVIKSSDALIEFLLITGVSKFSKVGVFSDLNNLRDLTISKLGEHLVGITAGELERHFGAAIDAHEAETGAEGVREKIREWYNGYSFLDGRDPVYNPWSLLSYFAEFRFRNFWFATGTPTFLVDLMRERYYYKFEQQEVTPSAFESYQLDRLETVPLLFQTGYLTIKAYDPKYQLYTLDYPNHEVQDSMLQYLMGAYGNLPPYEAAPAVIRLSQAFERGAVGELVELINNLFQSIPHQLFIQAKENLYHALIHLLFTYLGQYVRSEVSVLRGRVDAVVETATHVYVMEFKLDQSARAALEQIQERDYAAPYRAGMKEVVAIGINFSSSAKRIDGWEVG